MTAEMLAYAAGAVLSLAISYFPGLNEWFAALAPSAKRQVNLVLMIVAGAGVFGLSCGGWVALPAGWVLTCDQAGANALITAIVKAAVANQATYLMVQAPAKIRAVAAGVKAAHTPTPIMPAGGDVSPTPDA